MIPSATRPVPVTAKTIGDSGFGNPYFEIFLETVFKASFMAS